MALLVTGCPHNDYTVILTPHGDKMQRELFCYRGERDTNGSIKYEEFPFEELNAIKSLYPAETVRWNGKAYTAKGEFAETMPSDVGGAGYYSNLVTSMGSAGFYGERFRGNDDPVAVTEKRIAAANQLVDVVIGWSKAELGPETNYTQLRHFLDDQFRKDVKNAAFYWRQAAELRQILTNIDEEYDVRFATYLIERGYFKPGDVPALFHIFDEEGETRLLGFIQRLVARKMGVQDSQPIPASLAFLRDSTTMETSFSNYFVGTEFYRNGVKEWKKKHDSQENSPGVDEIFAQQVFGAAGFDLDLFSNPPDHLRVKLSLPMAPAHTNGKWDETAKQVIWDSDIESGSNYVELPVICYASWGQPDEDFQKKHFGRVFLAGENLTLYCLWQAGLEEKRATEWEKFLVELKPDDKLNQLVKGFRFSDEKPVEDEVRESPSWMARSLLAESLAGKPPEAAK